MQVFIRSKGFPITNALDNHIQSRIDFILPRFNDAIRKIEVFIGDENGPRGGVDKYCVVRIKTHQHSEVVVKDIADDLYIAIASALARAKQSLARTIEKSRTISRRHKVALSPEQDLTDSEQLAM